MEPAVNSQPRVSNAELENWERAGALTDCAKDLIDARAEGTHLRAALMKCATLLARAGLLLSRSNQAADAPASSISAELAIREATDVVEEALTQGRTP